MASKGLNPRYTLGYRDRIELSTRKSWEGMNSLHSVPCSEILQQLL